MNDDKPIKVHCDREMRDHLEFITRRYLAEVNDFIRRGRHEAQWLSELALTEKVLAELKQAGT